MVDFDWFVAGWEHTIFRVKIEIVILWVYYTIPVGFSIFWHFWASRSKFWNFLLAKDHWWAFSTRNAHMVNIANQIRFKMVYTSIYIHGVFISQLIRYAPGLLHLWMFLFWGPGDFPVSYLNRNISWNAWNRHSGRLWSMRGSYSAICSLTLKNVKWHSNPGPTVTSLSIRLSTDFMTLKPILTFTELWVVFMDHLQRVRYAIRERLPFRTPSSSPILDLLAH